VAAIVFAVIVFALFALLGGVGLIPFVAAMWGVHLPFWPTFFTVVLANTVFGKSVQVDTREVAK
jgi:hypothetical protein